MRNLYGHMLSFHRMILLKNSSKKCLKKNHKNCWSQCLMFVYEIPLKAKNRMTLTLIKLKTKMHFWGKHITTWWMWACTYKPKTKFEHHKNSIWTQPPTASQIVSIQKSRFPSSLYFKPPVILSFNMLGYFSIEMTNFLFSTIPRDKIPTLW